MMGVLAIGVWGLQWDERSDARPFAPEYREFRENHRVEGAGYVFHVPLGRMMAGWGSILLAAAALWPLATPERSSRWLGRYDRPGPTPRQGTA